MLALSKAFALASASDDAREIRDEVGFFQTVRAALVKSVDSTGNSAADREFAIQQILDRAVVSTEIVDILAAAGITSPDISILSDEFLAEIEQLEKKNLALEALGKLLNDEIRSRSKTNLVETKRFSERLEAAIGRYLPNLAAVEGLAARRSPISFVNPTFPLRTLHTASPADQRDSFSIYPASRFAATTTHRNSSRL